jgi:hypothetical protein
MGAAVWSIGTFLYYRDLFRNVDIFLVRVKKGLNNKTFKVCTRTLKFLEKFEEGRKNWDFTWHLSL